MLTNHPMTGPLERTEINSTIIVSVTLSSTRREVHYTFMAVPFSKALLCPLIIAFFRSDKIYIQQTLSNTNLYSKRFFLHNSLSNIAWWTFLWRFRVDASHTFMPLARGALHERETTNANIVTRFKRQLNNRYTIKTIFQRSPWVLLNAINCQNGNVEWILNGRRIILFADVC